MTATIEASVTTPDEPSLLSSPRTRIVVLVMVGVAVMSAARIIADNDDLTSSGTFGVALRLAAPIALAGLSGLVAERSGTVNIGLDGMMVMGTIFAGWWGWQYGPWMALLGGIIGGMLGGLLMSVATTTFGVNHIVAGVAINLDLYRQQRRELDDTFGALLERLPIKGVHGEREREVRESIRDAASASGVGVPVVTVGPETAGDVLAHRRLVVAQR